MELREGEESLIILVYNKENLKEHIFKRENKEFLLNIGYEPSDEINKYINKINKNSNYIVLVGVNKIFRRKGRIRTTPDILVAGNGTNLSLHLFINPV